MPNNPVYNPILLKLSFGVFFDFKTLHHEAHQVDELGVDNG